jgi:hypothetical protein
LDKEEGMGRDVGRIEYEGTEGYEGNGSVMNIS